MGESRQSPGSSGALLISWSACERLSQVHMGKGGRTMSNMDESPYWKREENKKRIKELASLMTRAADNPQATDDDLEQIVVSLRPVDPHRLDTAARGCPG